MRRLTWILCSLLLCILYGCSHRAICLPGEEPGYLTVRIDWSRADSTQVRGVTCYFFPIEGGSSIRFDLETIHKGRVRLKPGRYRVIAFNGQSDVLLHRGEGAYETLESYTRRGNALSGNLMSLRGPRAFEELDFRLPPDPYYSARLEEQEVKPGDNYDITLSPEPHYIEIKLSLSKIIRGENLAGLSGAISGAAPGYFPGRDALAPGIIHLPITLQALAGGAARGSVRSYGISPEAKKYEVVLFAVLKDGQGVYYTFDVTDQITAQLESMNKGLHLTIDTPIELPELQEPTPSGGMKIRVDQWSKIYIDLPM